MLGKFLVYLIEKQNISEYFLIKYYMRIWDTDMAPSAWLCQWLIHCEILRQIGHSQLIKVYLRSLLCLMITVPSFCWLILLQMMTIVWNCADNKGKVLTNSLDFICNFKRRVSTLRSLRTLILIFRNLIWKRVRCCWKLWFGIIFPQAGDKCREVLSDYITVHIKDLLWEKKELIMTLRVLQTLKILSRSLS